VVSANRVPLRAARVMLVSGALWFVSIVLFGQVQLAGVGLARLFFTGFVQSFCLTPLAAVMLRASSEEMRGRVMGIRMLAIWGLPLGLLAAGPIIASLGFSATTLLYAGLGLAATIAIGYRWRRALWRRSAAANSIG
jgi:sugar phosphate permease